MSSTMIAEQTRPPRGHLRAEALLRTYLVAGAATLAYIGVVTANAWLPARFLNDSRRIELYLQRQTGYSADGSYEGTLVLFRLVGLTHAPTVVGLLTVTVFLAALFSAAPIGRLVRGAAWGTVLAALVILVSTPFFAQYNKELFTCVISLAYVRARSRSGRAFAVVLVIAYGLFVRQYWLLIAAGAVGLRVFGLRNRRVSLVFAALLGIMLVDVLGVRFGTGESVSLLRANVLANISTTPDSAITVPWHSTSIPADVLNGVAVLFGLLIPVPLLGGSALHLVGGVFVLACWMSFALGVRNARTVVSARLDWDVAVALSFVVALALFEPDYGSYLRHLLPLVPVLVRVYLDGATVRQVEEGGSDVHAHRARN